MDENKVANLMMAQQEVIDPLKMWILFLFMGWSYGTTHNIGIQFLYYITLGGFGIWHLIRFFTLNENIRLYNNEIYEKYGITELVK